MLLHLYVSNTDHNLEENMLNPERLEEGWLVMKVVEFQPVFVWHRKRSEVELKRIAWMPWSIDRKWLRHIFNDDVGCREGYILKYVRFDFRT